MADLIEASAIGTAWRLGLERLLQRGGEAYDLLLEATAPDITVDGRQLDPADQYLARRRWQSVETVANTIFPAAIAASSADRETLYRRYLTVAPTLHRIGANRKGVYFERLINYPLQDSPDRSNQLELVVQNLRGQLHTNGPMRHAYELQIFAPGRDRLPRGFPCMSSLSLHLENGHLRLAATYRNQYYIQKALGNILGLSRLQRWIAEQAGVETGPISMHAYHAQVDPGVSRRDVELLLRATTE